jgi:hypothetical protein
MRDSILQAWEIIIRGLFFVLVTAVNADNRTFTTMKLLELVMKNRTVLYPFPIIGTMRVTAQNALKSFVLLATQLTVQFAINVA